MENVTNLATALRECDDCGQASVVRRIEHQTFTYGEGKDAIQIEADVPVWRCRKCDSAYFDEEGEIARHEAVCRALGRLTPAQIKEIRGDRSRNDFSRLTGIGEASLQRWENGSSIPNAALDTLLRLVSDLAIAARIERIRCDTNDAGANGSFRTQISDEQRQSAKLFKLRA